MTLRSRLLALYPAFTVALVLASVVQFARAPGPLPALALVFVLYLLPIVACRIHNIVWPLHEGDSPLIGKVYSPWFGVHHFQLLFIAIPQLEAVLRLVPGLYSLWLRMWGSRIGRGVYWTPRVDVLDRTLLDVGNYVVFGHICGTSGHIIKPGGDGLVLQVAKVRIGDFAFIGAGAYVGPGATIEPRALVRAGNHVHPFSTVAARAPRPAVGSVSEATEAAEAAEA